MYTKAYCMFKGKLEKRSSQEDSIISIGLHDNIPEQQEASKKFSFTHVQFSGYGYFHTDSYTHMHKHPLAFMRIIIHQANTPSIDRPGSTVFRRRTRRRRPAALCCSAKLMAVSFPCMARERFAHTFRRVVLLLPFIP